MDNPAKILSNNTNSTVMFEYKPSVKKAVSYQSEAELEKEFIKTLTEQGYSYLNIHSNDELINNLRWQISKLNEYDFKDSEWQDLLNNFILRKNQNKSDVVSKTNIIQEDFIYSLRLEDGSYKNIYLIDKNNILKNSLQVINQYEPNNGTYKNRYDVTVLINGLPLVHIELKRRGVNLKEAFNQIDRYKRESFWADSGLYEYIQIFVISNGTFTKYFSNTTRHEHVRNRHDYEKSNTFEFTNYWTDSKNNRINDLIDFAQTFFSKRTLLNIITKYCVFTTDQKLLVMRPYQIVAAEKIINQIEIGHSNKLYGKKDAGGYIWHTTGSGKTLTSFKTSILARNLSYISKVLFVVDRSDLDYQTIKEYDKFQKNCANSNRSTAILTKQLSDTESKIIITTIQKLSHFIKTNKDHSVYNEEVVIIFDECHRSQFGQMHRDIIKKFKKYYIFGFTGTPIFKKNCKNGEEHYTTDVVFGERLHSYTITDAIIDNSVLPFKLSYVSTFNAKLGIIDKEVYDIDLEKVYSSPERIENIVKYIIDNFAKNTKHSDSYVFNKVVNTNELIKNYKTKEEYAKTTNFGFNSLLACSSIQTAKLYYTYFKKFKDKHNLKVGIIYSYAPNEGEADIFPEENSDSTESLDKSSRDFLEEAIKDYNEMFKTSFNTSGDSFANYYKDVSYRVKNKELDILIVVNMFLTGFDAKTLNTLWVDKNLKYHGLIQAFSRTNRILNSIKVFGNIVCFRNLEQDLNDALVLFGNKDARKVIVIRKFKDYYEGYEDNGVHVLGYKEIVEKILSKFPMGKLIVTQDDKKEFIKLYNMLLKRENILSCDEEFVGKEILTPRQKQDYKSLYFLIWDELRNVDVPSQAKEYINDDLVFETELIAQSDVNIEYIIALIKKYFETGDEQIKEDIHRSMMSTMDLKNKIDLILSFCEREHNVDNLNNFINNARWQELDKIVDDNKLNKKETYYFMDRAFKLGKINTDGLEIVKLLPPLSRFDDSSKRQELKIKVIEELTNFFERFYTISNSDIISSYKE